MVISQITKNGPITRPDLRKVTDLYHTMIGRRRLDHLEQCLSTILTDNIEGDLIETGVWRGGATIFMRGFLAAHGVADRIVWAADSFAGLPKPSLPQDAALDLSSEVMPGLAVSLEAVKMLFARYGLLDEQVPFLKGWFKDTLSTAPIERLALLRLDGDLYESTMDALSGLYEKLSRGGFVVIDDYYSCQPCRVATDEFRRDRGITTSITGIDEQAVFWRKA